MTRTHAVRGFAVLAALTLWGCTGGGTTDAGVGGGTGGGGAGGGAGGGGGVMVASVTVSPASLTLRVGETQQLTAVAKDAAGATLSGLPVTWASTSSAVLEVDANGLASAIASGSASVTASVGGVTSAPVVATVTPGGNTVGPAGGTLSFLGGAVTMVFPAGAVSTDTAITVTPSTVTPPSFPKVLPTSRYDFGPEGITFAQPVTVTVRYQPQEVPTASRPEWLQLAKLVGPSWVPADSQVDATGHTVTAQVTGFSPWAITTFPGQLKRVRFPDDGAQSRFVLFALATDAQGNAVIAGSTQDPVDGTTPVAGGSDVFVAKYGLRFNQAWAKQLGSAGIDQARVLAATPTGVIGLAGTTSGAWAGTPPTSGTDLFVTALTADGVTRPGWPIQENLLPSDGARAMLANEQEQFVVLADGPGSPALRSLVTTYSSGGAQLGRFTAEFGAPGNVVQSGAGLGSASIGVYVLAQTQPLSTPNPDWTGWALTGVDATAMPLTGYPLHQGDTVTGAPLGLAVDAQGNVFVAAFSETTADVVRVSSFSPSGMPRTGFPVEFNAGSNGTVKSLALDAQGNLYVGGVTEGGVPGPNAGGSDIFVTSFTNDGVVRSGWPLQFGTEGDDELVRLVVDPGGAVVLAGRLDVSSASAEGADWYVARLLVR